jgi:hypothetical protein
MIPTGKWQGGIQANQTTTLSFYSLQTCAETCMLQLESKSHYGESHTLLPTQQQPHALPALTTAAEQSHKALII